MAESALEKLKRLSAAKKQGDSNASTQATNSGNNVLNSAGISSSVVPVSSGIPQGTSAETSASGSSEVSPVLASAEPDHAGLGTTGTDSSDPAATLGTGATATAHAGATLPATTGATQPADQLASVTEVPKPKSDHPLLMEMAELERALEENVPGFANILREIHIKLKKDPQTVTLLTDEEIGQIVAGLEKHANVTIVAPAATKAAKKLAKAPVSAGDL